MAMNHPMPPEARAALSPGTTWTVDGKPYRIAKITAMRLPEGWVDGVNYVPETAVHDAPNDYTRTWDDFLERAQPVPKID